MELGVEASAVLAVNEEGFLCFRGWEYLRQVTSVPKQRGLELLSRVIDEMGQRSAVAQRLGRVITSSTSFFGSEHRAYLKFEGSRVVGLLRVGEKHLFHCDRVGRMREVNATAVLDFYVHEDCQRAGIGKALFEKFLQKEELKPELLAYDKPSPKLRAFLAKHYDLTAHVPQSNNFLIFDAYFLLEGKPGSSKKIQPLALAVKEDSLTRMSRQLMGGSFKNTRNQATSSFGCPWAHDYA